MYRNRAFLLRHEPERRFGLHAVPGTPSSRATPASLRPIWNPAEPDATVASDSGSRAPYDLGVRWALSAPAVEIEGSVCHRKPTPKKRGSRIGFMVDPFRRREVWYESGLEEPWVHVLAAHPAVLDLREQQLVRYRDGGKPRTHVFDLVVTWRDGSRSALAVKYHSDVDKSGLKRVLSCVEACVGDEIADDYRIVTERHLDPVTIANARIVVSCALDFDHEARRAVLACLPDLGPEPTLCDIGERTGMNRRAWRAAIALVQAGCLAVPAGQPLSIDLALTNNAR